MVATLNSQDEHHGEEKHSIWYTYVGETGAATVAFLYIIAIAFCIYAFINWG